MVANFSKTFLFFGEVLLNLAIIFILALVINNLARLFSSKEKSKFKIQFLDPMTLLIVSGFSFLGFAIGLLVGFSISPVVQVVIPALLTFYGGFLTYLFSKDSSKNPGQYIGVLFAAMAVSFFLIYGVEIGTTERNAAIKNQKEFDLYYLEKEQAIRKKNQ